ncbi:MAG: lamin tail domain-containing protein [Candidatus Shapirobacteria bacterium]|jgi:hypothetical protein
MVLVLIIFLILATPVSAETPLVKITNYSSNTAPEWVEIQNQSDQIIDINNWKIIDGNDRTTDDFTLSGCFSPGNFLTVVRDESGWLNNEDETIKILDASGNVVDQLAYAKGKVEATYRQDNSCQPTPTITPSPTPVPTATNTPVPTNTPAPTDTPIPTPTKTPTPTHTPSPTHTPTPTKTPTPNPTNTNTPTPSLSPTPSPSPTETETSTETPGPEPSLVLGAIDITTPSPIPTPTLAPKKAQVSNILPGALIGLGSLFLLFPLLLSKLGHGQNS